MLNSLVLGGDGTGSKMALRSPLDPLHRVASSLDGSQGSNRGDGRMSIAAQNDAEAVRAWLSMFDDSPDTFRAYAKEVDRLMLWAIGKRSVALSSLGAEDILAYFAFLADPTPDWVGQSRAERGSADWRPLRGPLKESSARQAKTIVNALFTWLVHAGYLSGNPCALVRARRGSSSKRVERYIKRDEWSYLQAWIAARPKESQTERRECARQNHLFALLYLTAARLSDVAQARMGDITRRDDGSWWWRVVGKGRKEAHLPVTDELLSSIRTYREQHGLKALPSPGERTPLVMRLSGPTDDDKLVTAGAIYRAVKALFEQAASQAEEEQLHEVAAGLRRASTHWMRHTSLTHQVEAGIPLTSVRDNARHASIATTSKYLWKEDRERHAETSAKLRLAGDDAGH